MNKVILKILQARFQQYVNRELPDVQAGFRKGRGVQLSSVTLCDPTKAEEPEIKLPTSTGSRKRKRVPEKHLFLLY